MNQSITANRQICLLWDNPSHQLDTPPSGTLLLMVPELTAAKRPSPAAEKLLRTARKLFATEGIRAVGIDRIVAEANVAKATLYQNFQSKDGLIVAYLSAQDLADRERYEAHVSGESDPAARALAFFDLAQAGAAAREYRGCAFLNAATEFPGHTHPVSQVVADHRQWMHGLLTAAATDLNHPNPEAIADQLIILYDGGVAGSKVTRDETPIKIASALAAKILHP